MPNEDSKLPRSKGPFLQYNPRMRHIFWQTVLIILLTACQPQPPAPITILDGAETHILVTDALTPEDILAEAGVSLTPSDRLLADGILRSLEAPLSPGAHTLQVRRAVPWTLDSPEGGLQVMLSAAPTVGEALTEAGLTLHAADFIDPPPDSPLLAGLTVTYRPSRQLTVTTAGGSLQIRSSARTVGAALAGAGIPLQGLDYSLPAESEALPSDGEIRIVHVSESLQLAQKSIPFQSEFVASADVELDQQRILQPGIAGLSVERTRIRYEDGQEISRQSDSEGLVRPPQNRVVGYGTKVVVRTANVGGAQIEYWRSMNLFATSYSPCRSAADRCYHGTSSGKPVQQGVVAVKYSWYLLMQGQQLYIPGYGFASIEDVGGGIPGTPWIDLGYSDNDWVEWGDWVTVYFLTPVPASIPYVLD